MNIQRHSNRLAALAAIVMLALTAIAGSARRSNDAVQAADSRKADYIFLEALRQKAADNPDAYYALVEAAYSINPSDKYLGLQEGTRRLLLLDEADTSATIRDDALGMIHDYVDEHPSDLYAAMVFAQLSTHLGKLDDAIETWRKMYDTNRDRSDIGANYVDAMLSRPDTASAMAVLAVLDTMEQREGIMPDISMRRMRVYELFNDTSAIRAEAGKLLRSAPNDVGYLIFAGRLYTQLGDNDSALVFFNRAVDADPTNGAAYYNRAVFYNQVGDSLAYDSEVNRVMQIPDLDIEPKLEILKDYVIKLFQDSTQRERITGIFQTMIDQNPHEPQVRKLYADYLVAIKDYNGAAEQKSYELDMNPSDPQGWLMLSSLYLQKSDYAKAKNAALRGMHYFPEEVQLYELASIADIQTDSLDSALDLLDRALELTDSTDLEQLSSIYSQIGDIYYKREMMDSVVRYYDQAVLYNPLNTLALNNYAYYLACNEDGDLDRALEMIEKVMTVEDDNPTSLDTYAWVLFKKKNYGKAREIIDKVVELSDEPSVDIFDHAGDIYFMDGEPEKALEFWTKALKLDPENKLLKKKVKYKTFFYN